MPTTATNSATYLANSRLRIFVPNETSLGAASAVGAAASVRPSGESGWREMLICPFLARRRGLVSSRSAGEWFRVKRKTAATFGVAAAGKTVSNAAQVGLSAL